MTSTATGPRSPKRAISNLDEPDTSLAPQKRQRVYVACEHCRLRKQKCDSKRPACSTCLASGVTCVYGAGVKKRGLPPGYVRVLETLFGLIFSRIKNSEEAVAALLLDSGVVTRQWALGKHEDSVDGVLQKYKKSSVCKNIERLLEGEPRDAGEMPVVSRSNAPDELDWGNEGDNLLQNRDAGDRTTITTSHKPSHIDVSDQLVGTPALQTLSKSSNNDTREAERTALLSRGQRLNFISELLSESPAWLRALAIGSSSLSLQLPSNVWSLLDVYFTFTNCWLPIVQRQDILKIAHSYKGEKLRLDIASPASGDHAALWAIIALASHQAKFGLKNHLHHDDNLLDSARTYDIARSLIPSELNKSQIGHMRALLVLSLINCGRGHADIAWQLMGSAFQTGVEVGLIQQHSSRLIVDFPGNPTFSDNGLLAGCFIIDTLISAWAAKPSHFAGCNIANITAVDIDRLEEYEPWFNRTNLYAEGSSNDRRGPQFSLTIFNELLKLTSILHDFRSDANNTKELEVQRATTACLHLRNWKRDLPELCQLSAHLTNEEKLQVTPQLLHLHMVYNLVVVRCASVHDAAEEPTILTNYSPEEYAVILIVAYADTFGPITMPILFRAIIGNLPQVSGYVNPQLQHITSLFERTWRPDDVSVAPVPLTRSVRNLVKRMTGDFDYFAPLNSTASGISTNEAVTTTTGTASADYHTQYDLHYSSRDRHDTIGHDEGMRVAQRPHGINNIRRTASGISEELLYPISPMSIDGTFKRPDNPTRSYSLDVPGAGQSYQQQGNHPQSALDALAHGNQLYQQGVYDPRLTSLYDTSTPNVEPERALGTDFDLDQLFNDLAPLDQTISSQSAFMMNLGISGDLGFDMDTFFARPD